MHRSSALAAAVGIAVTACAASEPAPHAESATVTGTSPAAGDPAAVPPREQGLPAYLFEGPVRRPEPVSYQAEGLLALGVVAAPGEAPVEQGMKSFGDGWSGDAQLFWPAKGVGSRLVLEIPILVDGRYEVDAYLTRGPDFGILQFEAGGEHLPIVFDGYAAQVEPSGKVHLGTLALRATKASLAVRVVGRNAASSGHFAGIDRIVLLIVRTAP